ncbi:alpha/beta fold hydrolase [Sphingomonas sp. PB4P5]|uniref:alpha/beta fold hydrolase n=1 Tax=Parasphingomonas puruogangriensis TaxID=3096155 RepID=UPI002FC8A8D4
MYKNIATGAAPEPIVLLPGLLCDARIFRGQLAAFDTAVMAPDYGDLDDLGAMAERVLAHAPGRFAMLGHSMGGRVALEVWRRAPQRVGRLALVSTGVHPRRAGEQEKRHALRDLGRTQGIAALVDAWLPPMLGMATAQDAGLVARLADMCRAAGMARYEAQEAALLARPEVLHLLPTIDCPVLVMVGSEDRWSPPEQHRAIAAAIPHAALVVIDGAGHMVPAEAPIAVNDALGDWLERPTAKINNTQRRA